LPEWAEGNLNYTLGTPYDYVYLPRAYRQAEYIPSKFADRFTHRSTYDTGNTTLRPNYKRGGKLLPKRKFGGRLLYKSKY